MTTFRDKIRQAPKRKRKRKPLFTCGSCRKGYSNPLGHRCTGGGDLRRKRAAAGRRQAAAERRERERGIRAAERERARNKVAEVRAAERRRASERVAKARAARRPSGRPRPEKHDHRSCRDADCERIACEAYREGFDDGVAACPRTHTAS